MITINIVTDKHNGMKNNQFLDLMLFFEGYVRNYRKMNLNTVHNRSMFTRREIEYFANLGEMLGFDSFVEDSKYDKSMGRSRPMDLAWWKWDGRVDKENYVNLALHLERESLCNKDIDTIEKLFSDAEEGFTPNNVIGIQYIESEERMDFLNQIIIEKNLNQQSNVLMIYRFFDSNQEVEKVVGWNFANNRLQAVREAVCRKDDIGYWYMCFEEEFFAVEKNSAENKSDSIESKLTRYLVKSDFDLAFNEFALCHVTPASDLEMKKVNKEIRNEFKDMRGVYIYLDDLDNVLYVGIGKLAERVRFHYYESFGKYSGRGCEKHIKFFTQHQGKVKILWTVAEEKKDQRKIELILTQFLSPKYEWMKQKGLLY